MMRTTKIGGRIWAVGLQWLSYEERPTRRQLIVEADELGAGYMVRRTSTEVLQVGFGVAKPGTPLPKRSYSLAGAVASRHSQPWLGIFRLDSDLWWYIAVRDGHAVLPDGDVAGTKAEIHTARERHQSFGDWEFVQGDRSDLEKLLEDQSGTLALSRVVPCRIQVTVLPVAATVLGIAVVGAGYWAWRHHVAEVAAEQAARRAAFEAQLRVHQATRSPLEAWAPADVWMRACNQVIDSHEVIYDGWVVAGLACSRDKVTFTWARGPGGNALARPPGDLAQSGDEVSETVALPKLDGGADDASGFVRSNAALYGLIQSLGASGQIMNPVRAAGLPGADAPPQASSFASEPVTITMPFPPFSVDWGTVPGFRITELRATVFGDSSGSDASDAWELTGVIYER